MATIVTRDEGVWGRYLRKPGNIFEGMQTARMTRNLMQAMQDAGAIRAEVSIPAMAYIVDALANGMVDYNQAALGPSGPSHEDLLDAAAEMFDRMLTPEGGGNVEAGKAVLRQMAEAAAAHFDQKKEPTER